MITTTLLEGKAKAILHQYSHTVIISMEPTRYVEPCEVPYADLVFPLLINHHLYTGIPVQEGTRKGILQASSKLISIYDHRIHSMST